MGRKPIHSAAAPAAIGPYSQAIQAGNLLFLSGQIGLDPATGALVPGGVRREAEQALRNLQAVAEAAGAAFADVVRTTIYLADLADFTAVNEVYQRFVSPPYPARATVGVAALPKGARVEIDAIVAISSLPTPADGSPG
jgi:2-iminobutanoate/2-iminopropanoate deaminase